MRISRRPRIRHTGPTRTSRLRNTPSLRRRRTPPTLHPTTIIIPTRRMVSALIRDSHATRTSSRTTPPTAKDTHPTTPLRTTALPISNISNPRGPLIIPVTRMVQPSPTSVMGRVTHQRTRRRPPGLPRTTTTTTHRRQLAEATHRDQGHTSNSRGSTEARSTKVRGHPSRAMEAGTGTSSNTPISHATRNELKKTSKRRKRKGGYDIWTH